MKSDMGKYKLQPVGYFIFYTSRKSSFVKVFVFSLTFFFAMHISEWAMFLCILGIFIFVFYLICSACYKRNKKLSR